MHDAAWNESRERTGAAMIREQTVPQAAARTVRGEREFERINRRMGCIPRTARKEGIIPENGGNTRQSLGPGGSGSPCASGRIFAAWAAGAAVHLQPSRSGSPISSRRMHLLGASVAKVLLSGPHFGREARSGHKIWCQKEVLTHHLVGIFEIYLDKQLRFSYTKLGKVRVDESRTNF